MSDRTAISAVDAHAHVFARGLPLATRRRYAPQYDALLEDYLAHLDTHGISHGVLVQPSFLGTDNTYMLQALRAQPLRLRGIAVIDPNADPAQLGALQRAGVAGIRLNLLGQPDPDFSSSGWRRTLPEIARLGWHIELHLEAARLARVARPLVEREIDVVVDHFGRPDPGLGSADPGFHQLLSLGDTQRVWVKLSGVYRNGAGDAARATACAAMPLLKSAFGLRRLVWGSDWPHTQYESAEDFDTAFGMLCALLPCGAEREAVLVETPRMLFGFT